MRAVKVIGTGVRRMILVGPVEGACWGREQK